MCSKTRVRGKEKESESIVPCFHIHRLPSTAAERGGVGRCVPATTSTSTAPAVSTAAAAAATAVAGHFRQARIDALLGFLQDTDQIACLLRI